MQRVGVPKSVIKWKSTFYHIMNIFVIVILLLVPNHPNYNQCIVMVRKHY